MRALARLQEDADRRAEAHEVGSARRCEHARQGLVDLSARLERCLEEAQAAARKSFDDLAGRLDTELDCRFQAAAADQEGLRAKLEGTVAGLQKGLVAPQKQLHAVEAGLREQAQALRALEHGLGDLGQRLASQAGSLASARESAAATREKDDEARDQMRQLLAAQSQHADALVDELRGEARGAVAHLRRETGVATEQLVLRLAAVERSAEALTGAVARLQGTGARQADGAAPSAGALAVAESQGAAVLALAQCCGFVPERDPPQHGEVVFRAGGPRTCAVREWELQHGERLSERIAQTWAERRALHGARTLVALALQRAPVPPLAPA